MRVLEATMGLLGLEADIRCPTCLPQTNTGEPLGDAFLRGWDMHNGGDYEAEWDRDGKHDE